MGLFGKSYNSWEKEFLTANRDKHTATMTMWSLEDDNKENTRMYKKVKKEADKWSTKERDLVEKYPKHHEKYMSHRGTDKATKLSKKANNGEKF